MKRLIKTDQLTCKKCGEEKPRAEFKRRMTAEEYSIVLNRRVETGTTVISSLCRPCQPKRKPRKELTLKELRNKITNKRLNPIIGEQLIKEKREAINKTRSRNMRERWQKEKGKEREAFKAKLDREVNQAKNKYHAYKRRIETYPLTTPTRQTRWNTEEERLQLEQERKDHLAVLETQYRLTKERRAKELADYDGVL